MAILDDTRADWNARPPLRDRTRVAWSTRVGVSWHWIGPGKGPSVSGSHQRCLDQVRDWQHQHQTRPGDPWKDIGYNALICQHARAIEGRGLEFSGSHSPGVNTLHVGVQFMVGTDTPGGVTPAMLARAVRLRADLGRLGENIRRDWGHRDDPKTSTECPGNALYKWVHSGGPTADPTTATPQGDDMSAEDVKQVNDYTRALLLDGYTIDGEAKPSLLAVLVETQRRVTRTDAALKALAAGLGPKVEEAVRAALSADYDAKVELTPKAQP